jgi:5-methylcytosine-specific restriction endonuclease McrA
MPREDTQFKKGHISKNSPFIKGHKIWLGKKHKPESIEKMRAKARNRVKIGAYGAHWWRNQVIQKQNYTCQKCGMQDYTKGFMEVDHIKSQVSFPELSRDLENGQVLCPNCHKRKTIEEKDFYHKNRNKNE